jgi:tRNA wybutosine-synthesizing protein 3
MNKISETRFRMVKERHAKSLQKAIEEKKIDEKVINFCSFIAKTKNYFTSSSCSGRIALIGLQKDENKKNAYFHKKWHSKVKLNELLKELQRKSKNTLWFKLEPFIYHIGCKNLSSAIKLLEVMKKAGIKRGGIMVAKKGKYLIELQGTQEMSFPVKEKNKILLTKKQLEYYLKIANKKFEKNEKARKRFENACKELK